jgi:adenine-specific DNA methylase
MQPSFEHAKTFGAFYTDLAVAEFLVRWAVRSPSDTVLDPSFGGGVFLAAAYQHLRGLGGKPRGQIYGVELDPMAHARLLKQARNLDAKRLIHSDFFDLAPARLRVQAVVGNPPFIRFQRFGGEAREKALVRALAQGVELNRLVSSWAPFLVHSVALLKEGGRLAMVIPSELVHAAYARPLLGHLAQSFEQVTLLTFRKKLFALSQDTLLLLAEARGGRTTRFGWLDLEDVKELESLNSSGLKRCKQIGVGELVEGRLIERSIPGATRQLYHRLKTHPQVKRLDQLAQVSIGYVTGANDYFHLSPQQASKLRIPERFLKPALRKSRSLIGLRFSKADWQGASESQDAGYLFYVNGHTRLPRSVLAYIEQGEARQIHQAYKCRVRSPWYGLPQVHVPDAFLTYMNTDAPRLVANSARAVAPNTLHGVRLGCDIGMDAEALACLWQTSLTHLSAEIEGHSMGGGMLKLEPSEAARVLLATPDLGPQKIKQLSRQLDQMLRGGQREAAQTLADQVVLQQGLGLSAADCQRLSKAADGLRMRRGSR